MHSAHSQPFSAGGASPLPLWTATAMDAYVDSQGTMVDDSSQASTDSDASVSARSALDF